MKKQYTTPTAKKVTFNYEKVVANSGPCLWGSYYEGQFCHITHQIKSVSLASTPDCGWVVERV